MPIPPEQLQLLKDNIVGILGLLAQSASAKPTVDILVSKINDFVDENTSSSSRSERCSCLLQVCTYLQNELGPQIDSELWTRLLLEERPNPVPAPAQQLPQSAIPFSAEALYSYVSAMNAILGIGAGSPRFAGVPPLVAPPPPFRAHNIPREVVTASGLPDDSSLSVSSRTMGHDHRFVATMADQGKRQFSAAVTAAIRRFPAVACDCLLYGVVRCVDSRHRSTAGAPGDYKRFVCCCPPPDQKEYRLVRNNDGAWNLYTKVRSSAPSQGGRPLMPPETSGLVAVSASVQNRIDTLLSENVRSVSDIVSTIVSEENLSTANPGQALLINRIRQYTNNAIRRLRQANRVELQSVESVRQYCSAHALTLPSNYIPTDDYDSLQSLVTALGLEHEWTPICLPVTMRQWIAYSYLCDRIWLPPLMENIMDAARPEFQRANDGMIPRTIVQRDEGVVVDLEDIQVVEDGRDDREEEGN